MDREPIVWCLEGLDRKGRLVRVPLHSFPFRVGRLPGLDLTLVADRVSKLHAQIDSVDNALRIRDVGSRNGTFVDQHRINGDFELHEGAIVHFGDQEFEIVCFRGDDVTLMMDATAPLDGSVPQSVLTSRKKIQQMLEHQEISPLYQPIVTLDGRSIYAHESMSRGAQEGLPTGPLDLFDLAVNLGQAIELSRMMNLVGVESFDGGGRLFLNVHPEELEGRELVQHLETLCSRAGDLQLVVEVPETAITDPRQLRELRARLHEFDIGLAFDDFGAGRSRLLELFDSPPQYLKFDRSMITALAEDPAKRRLVEVLVSISRDKGVVTIAEGVETKTSATACAEAGFDFAQGFFFYRPARNAVNPD